MSSWDCRANKQWKSNLATSPFRVFSLAIRFLVVLQALPRRLSQSDVRVAPWCHNREGAQQLAHFQSSSAPPSPALAKGKLESIILRYIESRYRKLLSGVPQQVYGTVRSMKYWGTAYYSCDSYLSCFWLNFQRSQQLDQRNSLWNYVWRICSRKCIPHHFPLPSSPTKFKHVFLQINLCIMILFCPCVFWVVTF